MNTRAEIRKIRKSSVEKKRVKSLLFTLLALLFWVGVWWIAALKVGKAWLLPTPPLVLKSLVEAVKSGNLFGKVLKSLGEIALGYFAGMAFGVVLASLTAKLSFFRYLFSPLLTVIKATPVASFILILWVFLDRSTVPSVCVLLIVTPILWANCEEGILQVDKKLYEMATVYSFSVGRKLRYLYIPSVFPYFKTAALTALGMAWKAGVAAEVLCTPDGTLGQMIWYSKRDIETGDLFAYTLVIVLVCFLLEKLLVVLLDILQKRRKRHECSRKSPSSEKSIPTEQGD